MLSPKDPKPSTRYLKQYVIRSDDHSFVARIHELGMVEFYFDSYEELTKYPDASYAFHVNYWLTTMVRRIESLNSVADMMWLEREFTQNAVRLPVSKYQWVSMTADTFLMRIVSVIDCLLILTNEIFEIGLEPKRCSIARLSKSGVTNEVCSVLRSISDDQQALRAERNVLCGWLRDCKSYL